MEINLFVIIKLGEMFVFDVKMIFDDNVLYCYLNIVEYCDFVEEDEVEVCVGNVGFSFVNFDGNIGCLVNGVGFVMSMMDIIKFYGGELVNFFDVGGGVNVD